MTLSMTSPSGKISGHTLPSLFETQTSNNPDAIAVVDTDQKLTYGELDERANQLAHVLRRDGVRPDTPVGVLMDRSAELVVTLMGIHKAGGAYLPIEPDTPSARVAAMLAAARAPVCIATPGTSPALSGATADPLILDPGLRALDGQPASPPGVWLHPDNLAAVYFTSGSTGVPKGVACPHRGWVNRMTWMQQNWPLNSGETVLHKTTLTFDDAAIELFWPLTAGGCVALLPPGAHRDPRAIINAAAEHRVVHLQFVPSVLTVVLDMLTDRDMPRLSALRTVISSGEALRGELRDVFAKKLGQQAILINTWGVTEASIDSTWHQCRPGDDQEAPVPIGRAMDNNQVYILDPRREPVPPGVPGQLHVGGIGLARGYVNDPARTAAVFMPHPFEPGQRLYATGDRGYARPDGEVVILGREDRQVKVYGARVELDEVETVLSRHPALDGAAVQARTSPGGDVQLVAYVAGQRPPSPAALRRYLRDQLPGYMVPAVFITLRQLPLLANGKLDRRALPPAP